MIYNSEILPTNYLIYRKDRKSRGGGVLIAVNDKIPSKLILKHPLLELLSVELSLNPKLILICLYIPPNCSDDYKREVINYLYSLPEDDLILLGDLNIPDIDWDTLNASTPFSQQVC